MTAEERDDFLDGERTCRVATVGTDGPHVTALWFVWDGQVGVADVHCQEPALDRRAKRPPYDGAGRRR